MVLILDEQGEEQSQEWLEQEFGQVEVGEPRTLPGWTVKQLQAEVGPQVIRLRVEPPSIVQGAFSWPDAPTKALTAESHISDRLYWEMTKEDGEVSFPMGPGSYYDPATEQGAHAVWVREITEHDLLASGYVKGLGMIPGTVHRHLNVLMEWRGPQSAEEIIIGQARKLLASMELPLPVSPHPQPFKYPQVLQDHGYCQGAGIGSVVVGTIKYGWQVGFKLDGAWAIVFSPEENYDAWTILEFPSPFEEG